MDPDRCLELFLSNTTVNDKLFFEIVKNDFFKKSYFSHLLYILCATDDLDFARKILTYLKPQLGEGEQRFLERHIEGESSRFFRGSTLVPYFDSDQAKEVAFLHWRRTGTGSADYLWMGDQRDPYKDEVFGNFLEETTHLHHSLVLRGLYRDEIQAYLEKHLPAVGIRTLYQLHLYDLRSYELPNVLFTKDYKEVRISGTLGQDFPTSIFRFAASKQLTMPLQQGMSLPDDWSALQSLEKLSFMGEGFVFRDFSFLDTLPKIKAVSIGSHRIESPMLLMRPKKVPLVGRLVFERDADKVQWHDGTLKVSEELLKLATALAKACLTQDERERYFWDLLKVSDLGDIQVSTRACIALLNVSYRPLRKVLGARLKELCQQSDGRLVIREKSLVYIAGKPSKSRTKIRSGLKALHVELSSDVHDPYTHLVICKGPKEYRDLRLEDVKFVSEENLYGLFKEDAPGYIEEAVATGDENLSDGLLALLYSDETSNVKIGIEMLKNGGVPSDFVDPILLVYKTCSDSKVRSLAKKLLLENAPATYRPLISDAMRFTNLHGHVRAQEINKKLTKLAKSTSPKLAVKLALLFHKRFNKGLRYVLYHFKSECPERTMALQAMMEGTHFNFSRGVGFRNWRGAHPDEVVLYGMKAEARFPMDVVKHVPLIESADFHNCKFSSLPTRIGKFADLLRLDLSFNFSKSIPKSIEEMTKLEYLDLKRNAFDTFPSTLKRVVSLKVLDLRENLVAKQLANSEMLEEVKKALPDCEILV